MIPGWVVGWADLVCYASSECGAEGQENGGEGEELDLCSHASLSKLVHGRFSRKYEAEADNGQREESEDGEKCAAGELYIAELLLGMWVQGVEVIHNSRDKHNKARSNGKVQELERQRSRLAPSDLRMIRPQNALRKDEVHDEKENDTGVCKHLRCNSDTRVGRVRGPDDAEHVGGDARHAETEKKSGEDEFMGAATVELQDGHVEGGASNEEGE